MVTEANPLRLQRKEEMAAEACNGTNNDVNMQGMRNCNRHQLQKQQQDQRVKPQRALLLTMKLWRRRGGGGGCSTADSASEACLSQLRAEDVSESLELAHDKLPEEKETSSPKSLLLSSL